MAKSSNQIGFSDLFDFSDNAEIKAAIDAINELRKNYNDFKQSVSQAAGLSIDTQMSGLAAEIKKVADATVSLNITNEKSQEALLANLEVIQRLKAENEALRKSKEGARQTEAALADSVNGLTQKLSQQVNEFKKLSKSADPAAIKTLAAEIQVTRFEITELNNATKGTTSIFQAAKGSYAALDAETKMLVKSLQQMDNGLDANNMAAVALQKQIYENTSKLKAFDAQINQNFRNVGNYKSAFDGLGMSMQQIFREAPSAAVSLNTFFLAISNNLPMFFDEISKITTAQKAANEAAAVAATLAKEQAVASALQAGATEAAAAAEGTLAAQTVLANAAQSASPGIFTRIVSNLFSFQTALTAGVLLLTLYGGKIIDWVKSLTHSATAASFAADNLKEFHKVVQAGNDGAEKAAAHLKVLDKVTQDTSLSEKVRYSAAKQMQDLYPEILGNLSKEAFLNGEAKKQIDEVTKSLKARAFAEAATTKAADLAGKSFELQQRRNFLLNESVASKRKFDAIGTNETAQESAGGYTRRAVARQQETDHMAALNKLLEENAAKQKNVNDQIEFYTNAAAKAFPEGEKTDTKQFNKDLKDAKKAEKDLEAAIRKQDELIQAATKLEIAQRELKFAKSGQSAGDEISLEEDRLKILNKGYAARAALYSKDSKQYKAIQAEKTEAEKTEIEKLLHIREKDIDDQTKIKVRAAAADYDRTEKGWTDELDFETRKLSILEDSFSQRLKLYAKDSDDYKKVLADKAEAEAAVEARRLAIAKSREKAQLGVNEATAGEQDSLFAGYIKRGVAGKTISKDDARDNTHSYNVERINDEIRAKETQLSKAKEGDADYYEHLKELSGLRKKLIDENSNYEIEKETEVTEKKKVLQQAIFDFATETGAQLFAIGKELNAANVEDLQRQKDAELEVAGNNSTARAAIEDQFQKKILALKRKQAVYDKLQSVFDIGINTAVAVSKAVAASPETFGLPFSAFAIAQGALQIAAVIAKPLPKYYKGRGKGEAEFAEVNEQGFELIENSGNYRVSSGGRRAVEFLQKDDIVHTHTQSKSILKKIAGERESDAFVDSLLRGTNVVRQTAEIREAKIINAFAQSKLSEASLGRVFEKALLSMPRDTFTVDERGLHKYTRRQNSKVEHLNSRNSITGNG